MIPLESPESGESFGTTLVFMELLWQKLGTCCLVFFLLRVTGQVLFARCDKSLLFKSTNTHSTGIRVASFESSNLADHSRTSLVLLALLVVKLARKGKV